MLKFIWKQKRSRIIKVILKMKKETKDLHQFTLRLMKTLLKKKS